MTRRTPTDRPDWQTVDNMIDARLHVRLARMKIDYALNSLRGAADPDDIKMARSSLAEALAHLSEVTS